MAIQPINNKPANATTPNAATKKTTPEIGTQSATQTTDTDKVSLTSAQDIRNAVTVSGSAIDESRVAKIKAAVQAGDYKIDPARVADKWLQLETQITNST